MKRNIRNWILLLRRAVNRKLTGNYSDKTVPHDPFVVDVTHLVVSEDLHAQVACPRWLRFGVVSHRPKHSNGPYRSVKSLIENWERRVFRAETDA